MVRAALICVTVMLAWPPLGHADGDAAPTGVAQRYELDVTLDPLRHEVRGHVIIDFSNTSSRPLEALVFHLYLNAFRDRRSVFMRESRGAMRGTRARGPGSLELSELMVDGVDALPGARRELVRGDFSQLAVRLPRPLAPGGHVRIESAFVAKLPPLFARSGHARDFYSVAQWFPKLAKLEPNGEFASFPYHALGEFYADFADYQLTIRTPRSYVVGANGKLTRERTQGELVARTFRLERALDAVWVAGESLKVRKENHAGIEVSYVYAPGYDLALDEHARTVRAGLDRFGKLFGPYPYPTLTVVVPPRRASGAAGMEYPALFLTDGPWVPVPNSPGISGAFVTAHELAHQWFPMLVASNELRSPVLDEGLAEWAALDLLRARHGETGALSNWLPFSRFELERLGTFIRDRPIAGDLAAYAYTPGEYGASVYGQSALVLETIRRVFGRTRFEAALRCYASEQRFAHPTPDDLAGAFDSVYGAGFSERILRPLLFAGQRTGVRLVEARSERQSTGSFHTEVLARRSGGVPLPTWIAAYDAQGSELTRVLFPGESEALRTSFETREEVARVVLDPDRALLVDASVTDQSITFERASRSPWISRIIALSQAILAWVGP
jgi:hypothetical protein